MSLRRFTFVALISILFLIGVWIPLSSAQDAYVAGTWMWTAYEEPAPAAWKSCSSWTGDCVCSEESKVLYPPFAYPFIGWIEVQQSGTSISGVFEYTIPGYSYVRETIEGTVAGTSVNFQSQVYYIVYHGPLGGPEIQSITRTVSGVFTKDAITGERTISGPHVYSYYVEMDSEGCDYLRVDGTGSGTFTVNILSSPGAVTITGPETTWVYNPDYWFRVNPTFQLEAVGDPPGGTYKWVIIEGDDKVEFVKSNGSMATLRGKKPSGAIGDVKVKVTYLVDSQTSEDTQLITVQRATYLCQIGEPYTRDDDPEHSYVTIYSYEISDQFGSRIIPSQSSDIRQPFAETVTFISSNYPIKCPVYVMPPSIEFGYDPDGEIYDYLSLPHMCEPLPNIIVEADQTIWVSGWNVSRRRLTYYSKEATSEETWNPCPKDFK